MLSREVKRSSIKYRCTLIEIQQIPRIKSGISRSVQLVPAPAFAGCSGSFDFMPNHRPVLETVNLHAEITKSQQNTPPDVRPHNRYNRQTLCRLANILLTPVFFGETFQLNKQYSVTRIKRNEF